jgi:hypothetical protein
MLITLIDENPWMIGASLVLAKLWASNEKRPGDVRFVLGYCDGVIIGEKTTPECLVVDSITDVEAIVSQGLLDRYDSFMVADRHTWSVISARYGEAWTLLMPLPSIYSERFKIDRHENHRWGELRTALDAPDPVSFTMLNTLQWCIYNRRGVNFPINVNPEIEQFLVDIDTKIEDFKVLSLEQVRFRMIDRYPDIHQVFPQLVIPRNTGPFWIKNAALRVSQIVKLVKENWSDPVLEARNFASFAVTGKSNSPYVLRDWLDFDGTIAEIFNEYRMRARPYSGALIRTSILSELSKDSILVNSRVADILRRWNAVKTNNVVLDAQRMAYITTGNPDAEYISNIIDLNGNIDKIEELLRVVLYEHDIDITPSVRLTIDPKLPCFNLSYVAQDVYKGYHRSGWQYVANHLSLMDTSNGVLMDNYIDRTFNWNHDIMKSLGIIPYVKPWTGFIHHTSLVSSPYNAGLLLKNASFIQSLPQCQGLFVLSNNLAEWFRTELTTLGYSQIAVVSLVHPTETPQQLFSTEKLLAGARQLVQVGGWLRDSFNIYRLNFSNNPLNLKKAALRGKNMDIYFKPTWFDSELVANRITIKKTTNSPSNYAASVTELLNPVNQTSIIEEMDNLIQFSNISLCSPMCQANPIYCPLSSALSSTELAISSVTLDSLQSITGGNQFISAIIDWLHTKNFDITLLLQTGSVAISNSLRDELVSIINDVTVISRIDNDGYDNLLTSSVISIHLKDASAVNTINECVVRNTPICVNPLPAVVEILGEDYPLYVKLGDSLNITQAKITEAHAYLQNLPKNKLTIEYFIESLLTSIIGRRCWMINRAREDGYDWNVVAPYLLDSLANYKSHLDMTTYVKFMESVYQDGLISYDLRKDKIADVPKKIGKRIGQGINGINQWVRYNLSSEGVHNLVGNASDVINNIDSNIGKILSGFEQLSK